MNWRDEGPYYVCDQHPDVRCYKRMGGRAMTTAEYDLVFRGASPEFTFESAKNPGTFFTVGLRFDPARKRVVYDFRDTADAPRAAPPARPAHRPTEPKPLKPTPTVHEEIAALRQSLHTPGLHSIPAVLVPYRVVAPSDPAAKEESKFVAVGILELAIAEELDKAFLQQITAVVKPRARALLGLAHVLQSKAYVIVMSPRNSHFWVCNLSDRSPWEMKTIGSMPGFLSLLRKNS